MSYLLALLLAWTAMLLGILRLLQPKPEARCCKRAQARGSLLQAWKGNQISGNPDCRGNSGQQHVLPAGCYLRDAAWPFFSHPERVHTYRNRARDTILVKTVSSAENKKRKTMTARQCRIPKQPFQLEATFPLTSSTPFKGDSVSWRQGFTLRRMQSLTRTRH